MFSLLDFADLDSIAFTPSDGLSHATLFLMFLMLSSIIVIALGSSRTVGRVARFKSIIPFLRKIYVPIQYQVALKQPAYPPIFQKSPEIPTLAAHLYALNGEEWTLYTSDPCPIGTPLRLNLATMPDATDQLGVVDGLVTSCRREGVKGFIVTINIAFLAQKTARGLHGYFLGMFPDRYH